jgi:hypothetical protein
MEPQERVNREDWVARANPKSMAIVDALLEAVKTISEPRITYNRGHIAVGTTGRNFMWCHPRKSPQVFLVLRVGDERDRLISMFEEQGIECTKGDRSYILKVKLTTKELEKNKVQFFEAIRTSENLSHT